MIDGRYGEPGSVYALQTEEMIDGGATHGMGG